MNILPMFNFTNTPPPTITTVTYLVIMNSPPSIPKNYVSNHMLWGHPHFHLSPCGVSPLRRAGIKRRWCPGRRHKAYGKQDPQGGQSNYMSEGQWTGWDRSQPLAGRKGERGEWYQPLLHKGWVHKDKAQELNLFSSKYHLFSSQEGEKQSFYRPTIKPPQRERTEEARIFSTPCSQVCFFYKNGMLY